MLQNLPLTPPTAVPNLYECSPKPANFGNGQILSLNGNHKSRNHKNGMRRAKLEDHYGIMGSGASYLIYCGRLQRPNLDRRLCC